MWATHIIAKLLEGQEAVCKPRGNSMAGLIESGDEVRLEPLQADPAVGDIVLCRCNGRQYLHLVKATAKGRYQIGNNRGRINGWVARNALYGRVVSINGRPR